MNFDKMFNRKAAEYLNANGKKDDDLMEREVRIPEHMLPKKIVLDDDDAKKEKKMVEENEEELGKTIPDQILEAYKNQNYFKALAVAEPTADDIGDPIWPVTVAELSKAFRKRSLLTHPDKNPGDKNSRGVRCFVRVSSKVEERRDETRGVERVREEGVREDVCGRSRVTRESDENEGEKRGWRFSDGD